MISDLIYDVGMNDGSDTKHYLAQGYRVVAIEANPDLVLQAKARFADELESGRLVVEHVAVSPDPGLCEFWVNGDNSGHSSAFRELVERETKNCYPTKVKAERFRTLLDRHGVPFYLKIDIEDSDNFCLRDLGLGDLPPYISVEAHSIDSLCLLHCLGYRKFKCINQADHGKPYYAYRNEVPTDRALRYVRHGWRRAGRLVSAWRAGVLRPKRSAVTSGPFGEQTVGPWRSLDDVAYDWLHRRHGHMNRGTLAPSSYAWYDFHAKLG